MYIKTPKVFYQNRRYKNQLNFYIQAINNPKMKFKNSIYNSTQDNILRDKSKMSKTCTLETEILQNKFRESLKGTVYCVNELQASVWLRCQFTPNMYIQCNFHQNLIISVEIDKFKILVEKIKEPRIG